MCRVLFSTIAAALLLGVAGMHADAKVVGSNGANGGNGTNGGPAFGANGGVNIAVGGNRTQISNGADAVGANGTSGANGANGGDAFTNVGSAFSHLLINRF